MCDVNSGPDMSDVMSVWHMRFYTPAHGRAHLSCSPRWRKRSWPARQRRGKICPGERFRFCGGGRTTSRIAATHSSYNDMMCSRTSAVNIWKKAAFALWFVTVPKQSWHLFGRQRRMHLLWSLECPKTQWQNPLPNRHETPVVFRV